MNLRFEQTCGACPEQYDVFDDEGKQVAYVRLRWGRLRVDVPDCGGETILSHRFDDPWKGCFDLDERAYWMGTVNDAIVGYYK